MTQVGLRIDVDTLRGTRSGIPNLLELLARHEIQATFFFSVGPDNMGRHLWRLLRPAFLLKMLRTKASSLYGWDILLRGTLWPGPLIGEHCGTIIRQAAAAGHEIGLHAWDHHRWQSKIDNLTPNELSHDLQRGYDQLTKILGQPPTCFAAPAWRITPAALQALDQFPFRFTSDCRGNSIFRPRATAGSDQPGRQHHIQVPSTLPTYDELIGQECTPATYNDYLLKLIKPDQLNVLTIHAEVEGICNLQMFEDFINKSQAQKIELKPLGEFVKSTKKLKTAAIKPTVTAGREGWIAWQDDSSGNTD
jgi:undecaprenyl phosphate-alpha-L-ara4FN deformylase